MKKQVYEIDSNNFIKEIYIAEFDEQGNPLETLPINFIVINPTDGLYRAKWNGITWLEDMSQVDIDALNNTPQPDPDIELVNAINSATTLDELKKALTGGLIVGQKGKVKGQIV